METYFGRSRVEWESHPLHVYADLRLVDTLNDADRIVETTDHKRIRYGDVPSIAVTWTYGTRDQLNRDNGSGGAGVPDDVLDGIVDPRERLRARRIVAFADRWHLNTMTAGCVHHGPVWRCSNDGTVNGWPIIRAEGLTYPDRGDACLNCGRKRWDEPTDACPVTGYRYGTAWLVEVPPAEAIETIKAAFDSERTVES